MRLFYLFLFIIVSPNSHGQDYLDLLNLQYQNTPKTDFKNDTSSTQIQEYSANITLPFKLNNKYALITGFAYDNINLSYNSQGNKLDFSGYTVQAGANIKHNTKWFGSYVIMPKWASNFRGSHSKNFQLGGAAILKKKQNEHLKYVLGLYYNSELFGPFTTPLIGLYYKEGKYEADIILPAYMDLNYVIAKNTTLGFHFRSLAKSYNLEPGTINSNDNYIVQASNETSLYFGKEFLKSFLIKAYIGHTIGRSYRVYDTKEKISLGLSAFRFGDHRMELSNDFKNGLFFRLGMAYRFYIKE